MSIADRRWGSSSKVLSHCFLGSLLRRVFRTTFGDFDRHYRLSRVTSPATLLSSHPALSFPACLSYLLSSPSSSLPCISPPYFSSPPVVLVVACVRAPCWNSSSYSLIACRPRKALSQTSSCFPSRSLALVPALGGIDQPVSLLDTSVLSLFVVTLSSDRCAGIGIVYALCPYHGGVAIGCLSSCEKCCPVCTLSVPIHHVPRCAPPQNFCRQMPNVQSRVTRN